MKRREFLALSIALPASAQNADPAEVILRAMRDELQRSGDLRIVGENKPYFLDYALEDVDSFGVHCALGALVNRSGTRIRFPRVQVRVGSYDFDNTNYIYTDFFASGRIGGTRIPLDDDYGAIRRIYWLATDSVYKGAVEALARKRAALKSITLQEELKDFAKAEPVRLLRPFTRPSLDKDTWTERTRMLSGLFAKYPKVLGSQVEFESNRTNTYYVNTEGTELRYPDDLYSVRIRASAQAADGMPIRDANMIEARTPNGLPSPAELERHVLQVAENLTALVEAPVAEDYSGPVLVEGLASPQLFAQLVGANLGLSRRPVTEPGRTPPLPVSELEGRKGSRVLPEWCDVVDDPTQESYRGHELLGYYPVDMEGVIPKPVTVIENGTVVNYLLTRQPVRGYEGSNGRARLPGAFGAKTALFSNLFVKAKQTVPAAELKKRFLDLLKQREKPFGIVLRKLDYPSTLTQNEIRRLSQASSQRGGSARVISPPLLAYRVYPDGREELVRGLRFRSINVRSLRDIIGASDSEQFSISSATARQFRAQAVRVTYPHTR
jgi:hypothetical protein